MTLTDPIGYMFSRIRNGQLRSLNSVVIPSSNFRKNILEILKNEGYIKDFYIEKNDNNKISLKISLKYFEGDPVIKEIKNAHSKNQPVLVGTTSIEKSELISKMLKKSNVKHNVLNARFHEQEAQIIAEAGVPGVVTIATNMAGRGTDIQLGGNIENRLKQAFEQNGGSKISEELEESIKQEIAKAKDLVIKAAKLFDKEYGE